MATKSRPKPLERPDVPVSADVLALRDALINGAMDTLAQFAIDGRTVEVMTDRDNIWALIRRPGKGGLALRAAHLPGGCLSVQTARRRRGEILRVRAESKSGSHDIGFRIDANQLSSLRVTHVLTPRTDLLIGYLPRDLYPLDTHDDPSGAEGCVEAAQRGLNVGVCYFRMTAPEFGTVLYLQNLTAMNDYYAATATKPDGAVGGLWPELGYLPPTPPQSATPPSKPLRAGTPVTISDAIIAMHDDAHGIEANSARRFLQLLATAYRKLELPAVEYRDWVRRAEKTLHDLKTAPEARLQHYGHLYIRPYTAAEYPDIMVQTNLVGALREWSEFTGTPVDLQGELAAGLSKFYDSKLKSLQRYLPNVGDDKDAEAVDSWYLYYPLQTLGQMAIAGDKKARRLFDKSMDYAIRAARHFNYCWPIQFKADDFSVIKEARNDDGLGQTDVGGLYAYVMLQAFQLSSEPRFLNEAKAAIHGAEGMRFELEYQANLTAWGAAACARLWRITDDPRHLQQGYVYLASFFHNTQIWEPQIGTAQHYSNFLGATCLHDAPYMAMFECADSFVAFEAYLKDSGPALDESVRILVSEYCKYTLYRAHYYYPDTLPRDILASDVRNGHIDRTLSFPLEDLYPDGQLAGQVGQEIYAAGAAFQFATRAFHNVDGAPFRLYCDHFIQTSERTSENSMTFQLSGGDGYEALLCIVALGRRKLPKVVISTTEGDRIRIHKQGDGRFDYLVPANGQVILNWA